MSEGDHATLGQSPEAKAAVTLTQLSDGLRSRVAVPVLFVHAIVIAATGKYKYSSNCFITGTPTVTAS